MQAVGFGRGKAYLQGKYEPWKNAPNKYYPPYNPMEYEARNKKMTPDWTWRTNFLKEQLTQKKIAAELASQRGTQFASNANNLSTISAALGRPNLDQVNAGVDAYRKTLKENVEAWEWAVKITELEQWESSKELFASEAFIKEFICWLLGKSKWNRPEITPWGHQRLVGPTIREFVKDFAMKKTEYKLELQKLKADPAPPTTIGDAWIYWKYLVAPLDADNPTNNIDTRTDNIDYDKGFLPDMEYWINSRQSPKYADQVRNNRFLTTAQYAANPPSIPLGDPGLVCAPTEEQVLNTNIRTMINTPGTPVVDQYFTPSPALPDGDVVAPPPPGMPSAPLANTPLQNQLSPIPITPQITTLDDAPPQNSPYAFAPPIPANAPTPKVTPPTPQVPSSQPPSLVQILSTGLQGALNTSGGEANWVPSKPDRDVASYFSDKFRFESTEVQDLADQVPSGEEKALLLRKSLILNRISRNIQQNKFSNWVEMPKMMQELTDIDKTISDFIHGEPETPNAPSNIIPPSTYPNPLTSNPIPTPPLVPPSTKPSDKEEASEGGEESELTVISDESDFDTTTISGKPEFKRRLSPGDLEKARRGTTSNFEPLFDVIENVVLKETDPQKIGPHDIVKYTAPLLEILNKIDDELWQEVKNLETTDPARKRWGDFSRLVNYINKQDNGGGRYTENISATIENLRRHIYTDDNLNRPKQTSSDKEEEEETDLPARPVISSSSSMSASEVSDREYKEYKKKVQDSFRRNEISYDTKKEILKLAKTGSFQEAETLLNSGRRTSLIPRVAKALNSAIQWGRSTKEELDEAKKNAPNLDALIDIIKSIEQRPPGYTALSPDEKAAIDLSLQLNAPPEPQTTRLADPAQIKHTEQLLKQLQDRGLLDETDAEVMNSIIRSGDSEAVSDVMGQLLQVEVATAENEQVFSELDAEEARILEQIAALEREQEQEEKEERETEEEEFTTEDLELNNFLEQMAESEQNAKRKAQKRERRELERRETERKNLEEEERLRSLGTYAFYPFNPLGGPIPSEVLNDPNPESRRSARTARGLDLGIRPRNPSNPHDPTFSDDTVHQEEIALLRHLIRQKPFISRYLQTHPDTRLFRGVLNESNALYDELTQPGISDEEVIQRIEHAQNRQYKPYENTHSFPPNPKPPRQVPINPLQGQKYASRYSEFLSRRDVPPPPERFAENPSSLREVLNPEPLSSFPESHTPQTVPYISDQYSERDVEQFMINMERKDPEHKEPLWERNYWRRAPVWNSETQTYEFPLVPHEPPPHIANPRTPSLQTALSINTRHSALNTGSPFNPNPAGSGPYSPGHLAERSEAASRNRNALLNRHRNMTPSNFTEREAVRSRLFQLNERSTRLGQGTSPIADLPRGRGNRRGKR